MASTIAPESIGTSPLFYGLTKKDIDDLLVDGRLRLLSQGEALFYQGDAITYFYLIVSGTIQLHRLTGEGHEKTLDIVTAGQPFCESEMMEGSHYHRASSYVVNEIMVMQFPVNWLKETAKRHSAFALNLASLISQQAHKAEVEVEHQATMSASQLVSCFLQRLCVLHNFDPRKFDLPYSKTLIASYLGMGVSTLSRALIKVKKHGITIKGAHVAFHDMEHARNHVCHGCSIMDSCAAYMALEKIDRYPIAAKKAETRFTANQ